MLLLNQPAREMGQPGHLVEKQSTQIRHGIISGEARTGQTKTFFFFRLLTLYFRQVKSFPFIEQVFVSILSSAVMDNCKSAFQELSRRVSSIKSFEIYFLYLWCTWELEIFFKKELFSFELFRFLRKGNAERHSIFVRKIRLIML